MVYAKMYRDNLVTPEEAVWRIKSGNRVCVGAGCAHPQKLIDAMVSRSKELQNVEIVSLLAMKEAEYTKLEYEKNFRFNAFFVGKYTRSVVNEGRADFTPIFLSEIPKTFTDGRLPLDVAMVQVSPPDIHGFCSFGISVDIMKTATANAKIVLAELNEQMPRTLGDCFVHISKFDALVEVDYPIPIMPVLEIENVHRRIAQNIADIINDGATLQMGIGPIHKALTRYLHDKKDLGIHTDIFSDEVVDLVEKGVITNTRKSLHRGKIIASVTVGSKALYDFVDNNPLFEFHPISYTNDPFVVAQNNNMIAINTALQVDITGQVCAESLGIWQHSGIGGQVDFTRGAARSEGGQAIIALPSTAKEGKLSCIVPILDPGSAVTTSRGDVRWVVTEFGAADLFGKNLRQRAEALIQIAHPDFRESLTKVARERRFI